VRCGGKDKRQDQGQCETGQLRPEEGSIRPNPLGVDATQKVVKPHPNIPASPANTLTRAVLTAYSDSRMGYPDCCPQGPVAWCGGRPTASSQAARRLGLAAILGAGLPAGQPAHLFAVSRVGFSELLGRFPKCHLTSRFGSSAAAWVETCANCVPFGTNSIVRTAPAKGLPGRADRDAIVGPCLTGPSG